MTKPIERLSEAQRACIRLMVIGIKVKDVAEIYGLSRTELSRAYRSDVGQAYAAELRSLCEHYVAAMHVLGLVPDDILRPGCKYRTPNPPSSMSPIRRAARGSLKRLAGILPADLGYGVDSRQQAQGKASASPDGDDSPTSSNDDSNLDDHDAQGEGRGEGG